METPDIIIDYKGDVYQGDKAGFMRMKFTSHLLCELQKWWSKPRSWPWTDWPRRVVFTNDCVYLDGCRVSTLLLYDCFNPIADRGVASTAALNPATTDNEQLRIIVDFLAPAVRERALSCIYLSKIPDRYTIQFYAANGEEILDLSLWIVIGAHEPTLQFSRGVDETEWSMATAFLHEFERRLFNCGEYMRWLASQHMADLQSLSRQIVDLTGGQQLGQRYTRDDFDQLQISLQLLQFRIAELCQLTAPGLPIPPDTRGQLNLLETALTLRPSGPGTALISEHFLTK